MDDSMSSHHLEYLYFPKVRYTHYPEEFMNRELHLSFRCFPSIGHKLEISIPNGEIHCQPCIDKPLHRVQLLIILFPRPMDNMMTIARIFSSLLSWLPNLEELDLENINHKHLAFLLQEIAWSKHSNKLSRLTINRLDEESRGNGNDIAAALYMLRTRIPSFSQLACHGWSKEHFDELHEAYTVSHPLHPGAFTLKRGDEKTHTFV